MRACWRSCCSRRPNRFKILASNQQLEFRHWNDWTDPDFFAESRQSEHRFLPLFMRQLLPNRVQKTRLTLTGWILIVVALGIGSAAYNTASNILFLTLSLMLSSLLLSGILSWLNFRQLIWNLQLPRHLQAGELGVAEIALANRKRIFPSMSLSFRVSTSEQAQADRLYLAGAVSAGGSTHLEWTFTPQRRGSCQISLLGPSSKFPFGFIHKSQGRTQEQRVLVWPARVAYHFSPQPAGRRFLTGVARRAAGLGSDLLHIRAYVPGDPPRLIHWKATARVNKLMVRQLAQEGESGFNLLLDTDPRNWSLLQFERLCSVAASLADDLFHAGRLDSAAVPGETRIAVRSMRDLHAFFDLLAKLSPLPQQAATAVVPAGLKNQITFRPLGEGGVAIYVDEQQVGQADN